MMSANQSLRSAPPFEAGLYELNGPAKRGRPNEDWQQAEAARTGKWEDQRGKGNEVDDLVAPLRRWERLI